MRRWNGWGEDNINMNLTPQAEKMLKELIGAGEPVKDYPYETYMKQVPESKLKHHSMVSMDPTDRFDHAHGQSLPDWIDMRMGTLKRFPDAVAFPHTVDDINEILHYAISHNAIVIPYGGGTSVVGHLQVPETDIPVISLSMERLNHLIDLDSFSMLATFEAGVKGPDLESQLRNNKYTLGHYPQSFEYATLGGWVVTRSSGQQSAHFGRIENLFAGGELITPAGTLDLLPFPASAGGPDIRQIVMGSEGRLGVLSKAIVRISPIPERDDVYGVFFPCWSDAHDAVKEIAANHIPYSMIRVSNPKETMTNLAIAGHETQINILKRYLKFRNIFEETMCMCLIGFTGTNRLVLAARQEAFSILKKHKAVSTGKIMGQAWKKNRFRAPYLRNTLWEKGYCVDTLETAIRWDKVTPTMLAIENAIEKSLYSFGEKVHVFTHLSHVYSSGSSIYTSYLFRLAKTPEETLARWKALKMAASQAIVNAKGTISHQHGVGVDHRPYLEAEKGKIGMDILRQITSFIDPEKRMNPGKLLE